jgi:hypothetical protein
VFVLRRHRAAFSPLRHVLAPLLGALTLVLPFGVLFKPGQPVPYSVFPYAAVALLLAAIAYGRYILVHNPHAGDTEGSFVASE